MRTQIFDRKNMMLPLQCNSYSRCYKFVPRFGVILAYIKVIRTVRYVPNGSP